MRRPLVIAALAGSLVAAPAVFAHLDHPVPQATGTAPGLSSEFNSGGDGATWELLATLPDANPHSDIDFFTQKGKTYVSVGVLGIAANGGGQSVYELMDEKGTVAPRFVSNHPSASCVSNPAAALGLQHDVEATPKGEAILNTDFPGARRTDAQLLLDATDAPGRCHDQGTLGLQSVPQGGLEIIDITDIENPVEIGLTSHVGQAHTVNVDPRRPHIAYTVTSDSVGVSSNGTRANEASGNQLDGWEIVDLSSCMNFPAGTTLTQKREQCRPQVFRYRYESKDIVLGHTNRGTIYGCHELELYPDDRLTCGSGSAAIVFDIKDVFDDNGTPADFTDDKVRGSALPCAVRDDTSSGPFTTGAKVTDCVTGQNGVSLQVSNWLKIGAPSMTGVKHVGSAFHQGRETTTGAFQPAYDATQDVDFDHELEFTASRKFVLGTDERGGGVAGGSQCTQGTDLKFANGGIHAYAVDRLQKATPQGTDATARAKKAWEAYARDSKGNKAIFRAPPRTEPEPSFCTAHVFQQVPGQNRIFMGWYSQGTQVVDFTENADGTVDFKQAGWFIPENANQWVSHVFRVDRNADGTFTYYGATGDGVVGDAGRNGIDVYKVTLPAPPAPLGAKQLGPTADNDGNPGTTGTGIPKPGEGAAASRTTPGCTATAAVSSAGVRASGTGALLSFKAPVPVTIDVFRVSRGKTVSRSVRRVARFTNRRKSVRWNGRGAKIDGVYFARFTARNRSGRLTRRVTLIRSNGVFTVADGTHHQPDTCGLIRKAKLYSPAFGGTKRTALRIAYRLSQSAKVTVTVRRAGKVVRRFGARSVDARRTQRITMSSKRLKRGVYTIEVAAQRGSQRATVELVGRRL